MYIDSSIYEIEERRGGELTIECGGKIGHCAPN